MNRTFIKTIAGATILFAGAFTFGCQRQLAEPPVEPQTKAANVITMVADSQPTEQQRTELIAAKDALFEQLSSKLMAAMSQGPAEAIKVCQQEASRIAISVGEEQGVKIGRVGVRLRNPDNTGPAWAASMIASKTDTPVFANLSNGSAAALLPIKLQAQCLMCHGSQQQIAPVIQEQLARLYPNDEATGFQEGELRGWFWIEKSAN